MRHTVVLIFLSILAWMMPTRSAAQIDPALAAEIAIFTQKAKTQYAAQLGIMATQTTGHIWLKSEVNNIYKLQNEFNDYLNSFRNIISFAAEAYGFYYEISQLIENMNKLNSQIGKSPTNALVVAIHGKRNDIYIDIIQNSLNIVNTIRQVCFGKKMTEKQRVELVFSIRPKLKTMNKNLRTLTKLIKYTDMALVWNNITQKAFHRADKASIVKESLDRWKVVAKSQKVK